MTAVRRALSVSSALETISVCTLLINLASAHNAALAAVVGPVHGVLYLTVATIAVLGRGLTPRTRIWALVPVVSRPATLYHAGREVAHHSTIPTTRMDDR